MPFSRSLTILTLLSVAVFVGAHGMVLAHPHEDDAHKLYFDSPHDGGWLGVSLKELDKELRNSLEIDRRVQGALVIEVIDDSPAEKSGIKPHDVIVEIDGKRLEDVEHAMETIGDKKPGDKIRVVVNRGGQEHHLQAELAQWEENRFFAIAPKAPHPPRAPHSPRHNRMFGWSDEHDGRVIVVEKDGKTEIIDLKDLEDGTHEIDGKTITVERKGDDDDKRIEIIVTDEDGDKKSNVWIHKDGDKEVIVHGDHDGDVHVRDRVMFFDDDHNVSFGPSGGFLGVSTTSLGDQLREFFNVSSGGVLIESVVKDSPADKAGLKAGDVIRAVGDTKVSSPGGLRKAVRAKDAGDEVEVSITRDRKEQTIKVKLGEAQDFGALSIDFPHQLAELRELEGLHELKNIRELVDLEELHEGLQELKENLHEMHFDDMHFEFDMKELENLKENLHFELNELHLHKDAMERAREAFHKARRQQGSQI